MTVLLRGDRFYWKLESKDDVRIPRDDQDELERHAKAVRDTQAKVRKATAEGVLKIGAELKAAQDRLSKYGNGTFGKWVKYRCGLSRSSAYRAIDVFQRFGHLVCPTLGQFETTALYLLSAESAPEQARKAAIAVAEHHKPVTAKHARRLVEQYAPKIQARDPAGFEQFKRDAAKDQRRREREQDAKNAAPVDTDRLCPACEIRNCEPGQDRCQKCITTGRTHPDNDVVDVPDDQAHDVAVPEAGPPDAAGLEIFSEVSYQLNHYFHDITPKLATIKADDATPMGKIILAYNAMQTAFSAFSDALHQEISRVPKCDGCGWLEPR